MCLEPGRRDGWRALYLFQRFRCADPRGRPAVANAALRLAPGKGSHKHGAWPCDDSGLLASSLGYLPHDVSSEHVKGSGSSPHGIRVLTFRIRNAEFLREAFMAPIQAHKGLARDKKNAVKFEML